LPKPCGQMSSELEQPCEPNCGLCSEVFNLRTPLPYIRVPSLSAGFRVHGRGQKCKEEHYRRAARRQERLDGISHGTDRRVQTVMSSYEGYEWAAADELYDDVSRLG
jgi:hypothetical protein